MSAHVYRRPYDYALNLRLQARKRLGVGGRNIIEAAGSVSIAFVVDGEGLALGDGDGLVSLTATVSGAGESIANADSSIALSFALSGDAAAIAEADGSAALVSMLVAEGEGLVFEQLHSRFGADDGAEGANTQLAAEDVDVSLGKEATVRLRQQLDLTGHLTALSGRLYFKRVGDPDTEWEALAVYDPFGASKYGIREFDYDFDSSRLTTHMPDAFTRITANTGLVGAVLSGVPSNLEPRLVTQDGAQCAFNPDPADATTQRLYDPNTASNFTAYEDVWLFGSKPWAIYLLLRPTAMDGSNAYWMGCSFNSFHRGFHIYTKADAPGDGQMVCRIGNNTTNVAQVFSAPGTVLVDTWHHACVRWNGSGAATPTLELLINGTSLHTDTTIGTPSSGAPLLDLFLMAHNTGGPVSGYLPRAQIYLGVDHSQNNLTGRHYSLSKTTYSGFGLP